MSNFFPLSGIVQAVSQLAPIAAELIPAILGAKLERSTAPASIGLIDFIPDVDNKEIIAVNNANEAIGVSFQKEVMVENVAGVESVLVPLNAREGVRVLEEFTVFGDTGAISAAPGVAAPPPAAEGGLGGKGPKQFVQYLPFLTAVSFFAFGGNVFFERGRRPDGTGFWGIRGDSRLSEVMLRYRQPNGRDIDFKAKLQEKKDLAAGASDYPYNYEVPMPDNAAAEGILANFNVTLLGEETELGKWRVKTGAMPVDQLAAHIRSQLRRTA
jgi:hypothetical protein